jgi:hypothetical protein
VAATAERLTMTLAHAGTTRPRAQGDCTALHVAARWGNLECVQLLLERGANVGAQDDVR